MKQRTVQDWTPAQVEKLFWKHTQTVGACILWTGYKTEKGYGKVNVFQIIKRAHRVSYELANGPIAPGLQIDHKCHNPSCVNPKHLRATTHKQNQENRQGAAKCNVSGVRGVHWHSQAKRWVASITHNGKSLYLGLFQDIPSAEAVVKAKRLELFTHNDADRIAS